MNAPNVFVIRLSTGRNIQLREGIRLRAEQIESLVSSTAGSIMAEVNHNPNDLTTLGLKNLTNQGWSATLADGSQRRIDPGKSLRLASGTLINFGPAVATIREEKGTFALYPTTGPKVVLQEAVKVRLADLLNLQSSWAEVVHNPTEPTVLGLKNLSDRTWLARIPNGGQRRVEPGKSVRLTDGTKIDFGSVTGEIQTEGIWVAPIGFLGNARRVFSRPRLIVGCIGLVIFGLLVGRTFHKESKKTVDMSALTKQVAMNSAGIATVRSQPRSITVGSDGGALSLDDGATIRVPKGAFDKTTRLHSAIVDLDSQRLSPDLERARMYMVATDDDFASLGKPVELEIPQSSERVVVLVDQEGKWRRITVPPGPTTKIEIRHFSLLHIIVGVVALAAAAYATDKIFDVSGTALGVIESFSQRTAKTDQSIAEDDPRNREVMDRRKIEQGDSMTRAFYGVGEAASKSSAELCDEFKGVLRLFNKPENLATPAKFKKEPIETGTGGWVFQRVKNFWSGSKVTAENDLTLFLQGANAPSKQGGMFWEMVQPSMENIRDRLIRSPGQLSPAQFLKISIEENGNNVPLGILAAHNFLKDIAYRGRDTSKGDMTEFGLPASKLQSWRQQENIKPGTGLYDKLGPIYHVFAAMTAAYWLPSAIGELAPKKEAFLRGFKIGADRPDVAEGEADRCGVDTGNWAYYELPRMQRTELTPPPRTNMQKSLDDAMNKAMCRRYSAETKAKMPDICPPS